MRAAARVITGCPRSTPSHALMAEAGLTLVAARRTTLAARLLAKAHALPQDDPLRRIVEATPPVRLPSVFGWKDVGLKAWDEAGVTLPIEELLPARAPPWVESATATFSLEIGGPLFILYQRLLRYKAVDKDIAGAALKALRRHLWYLCPQTVMFALCKVGARVKEEMALKLKTLAVPESFPIVNVSVDEETCLPDLVDEQSWHVFATLQQCHAAWLSMPVSAWDDDPQFCLWKDTVTNMQVTNDVAERGVKLVQDFANSVTKSEPQLQNLLQLVEKHRRDVPYFKKSSLSQM